jgi:CPA1 family monovalent cation:H+ antiporter
VQPLTVFDAAAIVVVLAAALGVFNHRVLRLPFTIGLTVSGVAAATVVVAVRAFVPWTQLDDAAMWALRQIDLTESLMHGMLGFLLFAGALHVDLDDLRAVRGPIVGLGVFGTLISTLLMGGASHAVFALAGAAVPFAWCLVFGALISPTDPIAVLGIMKTAGAPPSLETKVAGESLFNDGVAVILFTVLLGVAAGGGGHGAAPADVALIFVQEVGGGIVLGLGAGALVYRVMRGLDEPNLEILLSVALVMGLTFVAFQAHVSAPLACVCAGLLIGNHGRSFAMTERTRTALELVWSFIDEGLNAVLFMLVGLDVLLVSVAPEHLTAAALMIPVALGARWVAVLLPVSVLRLRRTFTPYAVAILTWGGLKGAISIALALSLPAVPGRDAIVTATYGVVLFSIVVQGLTVGPLIRRLRTRRGRADRR